MYQMRIYTIASAEAAKEYATTCWEKHVKSLAGFAIHTEHVYLEQTTQGNTRVVALVRYDGTQDLAVVNAAYMQSDAFRADMEGFDMKSILNVQEITLERMPIPRN